MGLLIIILLILIAFLFMEFVAWFTHKYVMHGFLWILHKDHHSINKKRFEKNDFFAVLFAGPSIILIILGIENSNGFMLYPGIGIALYGFAYFLFHDVFYHRRIKLFNKAKSGYLKAIVRAHDTHHTKGQNFGFLFMVSPKFFHEEFHKTEST